jgi:hypothetical protein
MDGTADVAWALLLFVELAGMVDRRLDQPPANMLKLTSLVDLP